MRTPDSPPEPGEVTESREVFTLDLWDNCIAPWTDLLAMEVKRMRQEFPTADEIVISLRSQAPLAEDHD